jgi:hypothetical protein
MLAVGEASLAAGTVGMWVLLLGPGAGVNVAVIEWLGEHLPAGRWFTWTLIGGTPVALVAAAVVWSRWDYRHRVAESAIWVQDWNSRANARRVLADTDPSPARTVARAGPDDAGAVTVGGLLAGLTPLAALLGLGQVLMVGQANLAVPLAGIAVVSVWLLVTRIRLTRLIRSQGRAAGRVGDSFAIRPVLRVVPPERVAQILGDPVDGVDADQPDTTRSGGEVA